MKPQHSPVSPHSSHGHRRQDEPTTRRLAQAIDALRRESEAVLWELNSLRTQNSALEQRILSQADELGVITRSLTALREQHTLMEQQYKEKLRALRAELRALQEGGPSTTIQPVNSSASARERLHSPTPPDWPPLLREQPSTQSSRPQLHPVSTPPGVVIPVSLRARTRDVDKEIDTTETAISRAHATARSDSSQSPPSLRHMSSYSPYNDSPRLSPQWHHVRREDTDHTRARPHRPLPTNVPSPTRHEPSPSPTATLIGSDAPSRPKSRKGRP